MAPIDLFCVLLAVTVGTAAVFRLADSRRRRALKQLAVRWGMHYSPRDPFRLANRIAVHLEIPGAAEVRLRDLVYGIEAESYRYFFTLEYTIGAVHALSRIQCVATFIEARHGREHGVPERPVICDIGRSLPLVDRYAQLRSRTTGPSLKKEGDGDEPVALVNL